MAVKKEKLVFCRRSKIDKVQLIEVKVVCFIKPIISEILISDWLYGLLQGYIRCQSSIRGPHSQTQRCRLSYIGLGREVLLCHLAIWRGHYFKSE